VSTLPFDHGHANPWTTDFVDLPDLNARASDAIAGAVRRVRDSAKGDRADIASASILVLGPAGAGKTHLFARLRRKIGPRALFVHLRPLVGTHVTPRYVLGEIARQLDYAAEAAGDRFRQLDALVGATLAYLRLESVTFPHQQLDRIRSLDERARRDEVDWAVEQLVQRHPEIDDAYASRLLSVPFAATTTERRASLAWLSGQDLEQSQMDRLGVPASLSEERVVPALRTLGLLATPGAPIVLVFDQLENLMDGDGEARVRSYANLVAELFDTVRGVVLVQMALVTEWATAIEPKLGATQKTRLCADIQALALPTAAQKRELVRLWAERMPDPRGPFPAPFGEARLARWCAADGMTPRMLMAECKRAILEGDLAALRAVVPPSADTHAEAPAAGEAPEGDATAGGIAAAWEDHLAGARRTLDEAAKERRGADPARLLGGMACAFRLADEGVAVALDARRAVQLRVRRAGAEHAFCLLHQRHHKTVGAALDDAREAMASSALVVVLREQAIELPPSWKQTRAKLADLSGRGVRFQAIARDDAARLLALESLLCSARSGDVEDTDGRPLSEREVATWARSALSPQDWPVVRAGDGATGDDALGTAALVTAVSGPEAAGPNAAGATVEACLAQLRIASVDRLVREVARIRVETTRTQVIEALEWMGKNVRWFGRSIVARRDER
jgi:hypothetical protein